MSRHGVKTLYLFKIIWVNAAELQLVIIELTVGLISIEVQKLIETPNCIGLQYYE